MCEEKPIITYEEIPAVNARLRTLGFRYLNDYIRSLIKKDLSS